jgi:hypothetical protein
MTEQHNDQLAHLLRQWADRQAPSKEEIDWLQARVMAAIDDETCRDGITVPPPHRLAMWGRVMWFSLGVAATILVVAFLWHRGHVGLPNPVQSAEEDTSTLAWFSAPQLEEKAVLLSEMERLFTDRLAWVAEDGREVRVALAGDAEKTSQGVPIAVRVVAVARRIGSDQWKPVWNVDVVTRGEQLVDLVPPGRQGEKFQAWALPLPDGMVAVDANLTLNGGVATEASFSGIQKAGAPNRIFTLKKGDVEFEVYQTVALLKEKVG